MELQMKELCLGKAPSCARSSSLPKDPIAAVLDSNDVLKKSRAQIHSLQPDQGWKLIGFEASPLSLFSHLYNSALFCDSNVKD